MPRYAGQGGGEELETYEESLNKGGFCFGQNWAKFNEKMNDDRLAEARISLNEWLGDLEGKSFIDVGSGSGLFSWAADSLGAEVTSVDVDRFSVECTKHLRSMHDGDWKVVQGSILDKSFLRMFGEYDVVYSWGVLHHTGKMWEAFTNTAKLVKPGGVLMIAVYNDNHKYWLEGTSKFWAKLKWLYNKAWFLRWPMYWAYSAYYVAGLMVSRRNPVKHIKGYTSVRGMDFWTDIKDWLGGYPYEYASTTDVVRFFEENGFTMLRVKGVRSLGCNEYLFRKDKR